MILFWADAPLKCDANNGWHEYNNRCYWWSGVDREKYEDAEQVCTQFGGHVVSIGDETEQKFVQNIQAFEGLPFWIGLTDQVGVLDLISGLFFS